MPNFTLPRLTRVFVLLIAGLLLMPGTSGPAQAAGLTTHWYMGAIAIPELHDKNLRKLLIAQSVWYRRGTMFPDAAIEHLKNIKASKADQDYLTHNNEEPDGGFFTRYLEQVIQHCGKDLTKAMVKNVGHCHEAMAFFFGMIIHAVADAPWHAEYIGETTVKYCPKVEQVWGGKEYRHGIADTDFDICLSSRLHGNKNDVTNIVRYAAMEDTPHKPSLNKAAPCSKGEFFSPAKGGRCFKCPSGYSPSGALGDSSSACVKTSYKKGTKHGVPLPLCPQGQWLSAHDAHCYTCASGYTHDNSKAGNDSHVCFKKSHKKAADNGAPSLGCDNGETFIPGVAHCRTCPSGYTRNAVEPARSLKGCARKVTAPCSVIKVSNAGLAVSAVVTSDMVASAVLPAKKVITDLMTKAYKANGHTVDVDAINTVMDTFYKKALTEPLASLSDIGSTLSHSSFGKQGALTEHAGSCKGLFEHGLDGHGGDAKDSAKQAAKSMNAIWNGLSHGKEVKFVRTGSFNYRVMAGDKQTFCYGGC